MLVIFFPALRMYQRVCGECLSFSFLLFKCVRVCVTQGCRHAEEYMYPQESKVWCLFPTGISACGAYRCMIPSCRHGHVSRTSQSVVPAFCKSQRMEACFCQAETGLVMYSERPRIGIFFRSRHQRACVSHEGLLP